MTIVCEAQPLQESLGGQRITAAKVAATVAGERCWIKWPYLQEATVSAVSGPLPCEQPDRTVLYTAPLRHSRIARTPYREASSTDYECRAVDTLLARSLSARKRCHDACARDSSRR